MDRMTTDVPSGKRNEDAITTSARIRSERGQGLAEYTIILALVGVAALAGMAFFGAAIKNKISAVAGSVAGVSASEINRDEQRAKSAYKGASDSASEVSGMQIETRGRGREVIDKESLR